MNEMVPCALLMTEPEIFFERELTAPRQRHRAQQVSSLVDLRVDFLVVALIFEFNL
jgi:hypothetical protein